MLLMGVMSMSTDQLRFLSVDDLLILMHLSEAGMSVTDVAKRLKLTQPAVTQRLRKMEEAFGKKIIERKGRGVQLTVFGKEISERATMALSALNGVVTPPMPELPSL
jgi:DNA-binding transcriptional LysR family regulator